MNLQCFSRYLPLTEPPATGADPSTLASLLDRAADAALFLGRTGEAERLAHHAAAIREGV